MGFAQSKPSNQKIEVNKIRKSNHKMHKEVSFEEEKLKNMPALGINPPNPNLAIIQRCFLLRQLLSVHSQLQPETIPHKAQNLREEEGDNQICKTLEIAPV